MQVALEYNFRSALLDSPSGQTLSLSPNLAREAVSFDALLLQPVRFREAISALHDVVISDLRFKKKDKSQYLAWKQSQQQAVNRERREQAAVVTARVRAAEALPVPPTLAAEFETSRKKYWQARTAYDRYLREADPGLWRKLVPYDPVITVAPDTCLFECFSGDESSYGCLSVDRETGFGHAGDVQLGTTNVDYSWDLYHHFQTLRSYRQTRFKLDPQRFAAATAGGGGAHYEEKIDLPTSWLRGFMQLQVAAGLPATRLTLGREAVYSLIAWLKRNIARTSPRALRFELEPGRPPRLVMEPWERAIDTYGATYDGPPVAPIRVWGVRRLLMIGRLLPLVDRVTVHLLGTGLPHFWVAEMGDMRLTLGFSGWTTNDWTRASALEMLQASGVATEDLVTAVADHLRTVRSATLAELERAIDRAGSPVRAALSRLANAGQVIYDLHAGVFRWRQILPRALGEAEIGPEPQEMQGLRKILGNKRVTIETRELVPDVGLLLAGQVESNAAEVLVDFDGRIKRGKCQCSWFRKYALKNGPCRHMMALRYLDPERAGGVLGPPPLRGRGGVRG